MTPPGPPLRSLKVRPIIGIELIRIPAHIQRIVIKQTGVVKLWVTSRRQTRKEADRPLFRPVPNRNLNRIAMVHYSKAERPPSERGAIIGISGVNFFGLHHTRAFTRIAGNWCLGGTKERALGRSACHLKYCTKTDLSVGCHIETDLSIGCYSLRESSRYFLMVLPSSS